MQNGGGQVPLQGPSLPSIFSEAAWSRGPGISSDIPPTHPPVELSSTPPNHPLQVAPDASLADSPSTVIISTEDDSYELASGQDPNDLDAHMKGRKPAIAAAGTFLSLFGISQLYQQVVFPKITPPSERAEDKKWVASSQSWVDRKACNWFGICGLTHLNKAGWTTPGIQKKKQEPLSPNDDKIDLSDFMQAAQDPPDWSEEEYREREVPEYVLEYAPLIHLYSGEEFWPCDMAEHLIHTTPHLNYTPLQATSDHPNLTNLDDLNKWGRFVYLQSDDNVEDRPEWLGGETNIPNVPDDSDSDPEEDHSRKDGDFVEDEDGEKSDWWNVGIGDTVDKGGIRVPSGVSTATIPVPTDTPEGEELVDKPKEIWQPELLRRKMAKRGRKVVGGRSDAPAALVVVPKDDGVVDAFWFFFYSYNLGNSVFNVRFGNHVGDWEHTLIRFHHGVPKAVFFSEHSFGEAYTYEAVEKVGKRPVGYSATGTHAMYATPGTHPYILPGGILHDETDRGPLWDPTLNMYSFTYNYRTDKLLTSNLTPKAPIGWFYFNGHWGDKFYPLSDPRQYRFVGQYHYVNGPLGPRFKNLGRQEVCQGNDECVLKRWIGSKREQARNIKRYPSVGEGEEMSEEDVRRFAGPEPVLAS